MCGHQQCYNNKFNKNEFSYTQIKKNYLSRVFFFCSVRTFSHSGYKINVIGMKRGAIKKFKCCINIIMVEFNDKLIKSFSAICNTNSPFLLQ